MHSKGMVTVLINCPRSYYDVMDEFVSPKLRMVTTYSRGRTFVASFPLLKSSSYVVEAKRPHCISKGELILKEKPVIATLIDDVGISNVHNNRVLGCNAYVQFIISSARTIERDVSAYEKVDALCSNLNRRSGSDLDDIRRFAKKVAARTSWSLSDCESLVDKMQSNAFGITDREMNVIGFGLYANAAVLNHSCDPNCIQYFEGDTLHIRSLRNIAEGEEITIAYIDVAEPTHSRQENLLRTYAFRCYCSKCSLSELGGFKCKQRGCRGILGLSSACSVAQYINWLRRGKSAAAMHTAAAEEGARFLRCFPIDITEYMRVYSESGSISISTMYSTRYESERELQLVCSSCNNSVSFPELCKDLNHLFRLWRAIREEKTLSSLLKYYDCVSSLVVPRSYLLMDAGSRLALAMISARRYEEALKVSMASVVSFRALYPQHFPVVAIQEFQIAKLLALLNNIPQSREHMHRAIAGLRIALGSRNTLTQEAEHFVSTL